MIIFRRHFTRAFCHVVNSIVKFGASKEIPTREVVEEFQLTPEEAEKYVEEYYPKTDNH